MFWGDLRHCWSVLEEVLLQYLGFFGIFWGFLGVILWSFMGVLGVFCGWLGVFYGKYH